MRGLPESPESASVCEPIPSLNYLMKRLEELRLTPRQEDHDLDPGFVQLFGQTEAQEEEVPKRGAFACQYRVERDLFEKYQNRKLVYLNRLN